MTFLEKKSAREFVEGDIIFKEGDPGSSMFIIKSGRVEVSAIKNEQKIVYAELGRGAIFGEMALIDGHPRSATVVALTRTTCVEMSRMLFQKNLEGLPAWLRSFFQILAERLRETNKKADTLTHQDNSRQVVLIVSSILSGMEPNALDEIITPWKPLAKDVALLLNLPYDQVDQVLNKMALTPMVTSQISQEHGRMLVMKDYNQFKFFADFCRSRFSEKHGDEIPDQFKPLSLKEREIISYLQKIMQEQRWEPEIEQHLFEERFDDEHKTPLSGYRFELKKFRKSELISSKLDQDDSKIYIIDKDKLRTQISMIDTLEEFESMDSKL